MHVASTRWFFRHIVCLAIVLSPTGWLPAQDLSKPVYEVKATKYLLGTKVDFAAMHHSISDCKLAFYHGFQEMARLENLLSSHQAGSDISRINEVSGKHPVKVAGETFAIVKRAIEYSYYFGGDFDVTIGPLTQMWGFNDDGGVSLPTRQALKDAKDLVGFKQVMLNEADTTVFLERPGMKLDLGGIAKGYAIDRAAAILSQQGVRNFIINAGGDIYACGSKTGERKWAVGLQHPRKPGELLATFEAQDVAVATSGDYQRYKFIDGIRYHHIIDPHTGMPADRNQSVTVFSATAEQADVWATYLFIVGKKNALRCSEIEALFVTADGIVECNRNIKKEYAIDLFY